MVQKQMIHPKTYKEMKSKINYKMIGIALLSAVILGGATVAVVKIVKKKKNNANSGGGTTTTTSTTSGGLWTTRTAAETTAIQTKINDTYNQQPSFATTTAWQSFKNMMGGTIAVDGKYGSDTTKAVSALQTFLKACGKDIGKSGIDGKYGKDTDNATGCNILK
jgi:cytoskeletal protein RodZ